MAATNRYTTRKKTFILCPARRRLHIVRPTFMERVKRGAVAMPQWGGRFVYQGTYNYACLGGRFAFNRAANLMPMLLDRHGTVDQVYRQKMTDYLCETIAALSKQSDMPAPIPGPSAFMFTDDTHPEVMVDLATFVTTGDVQGCLRLGVLHDVTKHTTQLIAQNSMEAA